MREAKRRKREDRVYFLKQKLCGVAIVACGMIPIIAIHDGTASVIAIPLGMYLIFTKKKAMNFD